MADPIKMDNWSLINKVDGVLRLLGKVGTRVVVTSEVVKQVGERLMETKNGTVYELGNVNPYYMKMLSDVDSEWDGKGTIPIRVLNK